MAAVASRYARALADVVTQPNPPAAADAVESELRAFEEMLRGSAELRIVMETPAVKVARKKSLLEALGAKMGLSTISRNFLFILADHRRMTLLGEILHLFRALVDERMGMVAAQVASAQPLAVADRAQLEAALGRRVGRKVRASYTVDPALIGGVVTRVGSTIFDGSVREQLRLLRAQLSSE